MAATGYLFRSKIDPILHKACANLNTVTITMMYDYSAAFKESHDCTLLYKMIQHTRVSLQRKLTKHGIRTSNNYVFW